jgi:hypothetical protein
LSGAGKAEKHGHYQRHAALDERPAQIFQVLEKRFYSATFDLFVFGPDFLVAFRHDSG